MASRTRRVSIVVLNYNGLEDTLRCLESLRDLADPADVILVDNGSRVNPVAEATRTFPGLQVIETGENLGYAGGNNRGIRYAIERGAEYILILNNDTVVAPSIVHALLGAFDADPKLGVVGPVVNFMDERDAVMTDGVAFNPGPGTEFFRRIVVPVDATAAVVPVDIVNGCCMMLSADLVARVGMFDEQFFIVHEESDLCLRALRAGFGCAVLGQSLVWHKGSSAFERSGRELQRYFDARNLHHLLARHTGHVAKSRPWRSTLLHYLRYAFYRYDIELEAGKPAAAKAVVDGLYDGFTNRYGPYARTRRAGRAVVSAAFAGARRLAHARRGPTESS
ncbi:MAG: glycosyltransferase family 2 protein [Acidobacteriota bacterium]